MTTTEPIKKTSLTPTTVAARFSKGGAFSSWKRRWKALDSEAKRDLCDLIASGVDIEMAFKQVKNDQQKTSALASEVGEVGSRESDHLLRGSL